MAEALVVPAEHAHIAAIAEHARAADYAELLASSGISPMEAMEAGLRTATGARTGMVDGVPVCMFGISPISLLGGIGVPWMIGTDLLEQHQFVFLRRCKRELGAMADGYTYLINWVDDRNTVAQRWLRWLGFTLYDPEPYGVAGLPFRRFDKRG